MANLTAKDMVTRVAGEVLSYMHKQLSGETGKIAIEWARQLGANIPADQEAAAIQKLRDMIPEPAQWPLIEIKTHDGVAQSKLVKGSNKPKAPTSGTGGKKGPAGGGRKSESYPALIIPPGQEAPKCQVILGSGANKGNMCGRVCSRVLDEHDMTNQECVSMKCRHIFCGQHVSKGGGGDEIKAYDRLTKSTEKAGAPIVSNGTVVDGAAIDSLSSANVKSAGNDAMAKIMAAMKSKKAQEEPPK